MNMTQMRTQLADWGYDPEMCGDLDSANLKEYYAAAVAEQEAKEQSDVAGDGQADSLEDSEDLGDEVDGDADRQPETPSESESAATVAVADSPVNELEILDEPPPDALIVVEAKSQIMFTALDEVAVASEKGGRRFVKGQVVKVKEGQQLAVGDETFAYLDSYKLVKPLGAR